MKRYICLTLLFLFTVMCSNSFAVQITVGTGSANPGQSVSLPITVDTPGEIAGAAFTLTYDTAKLTLISVSSTFFDTFTNQWTSLSLPDPLPPDSVNVDGQTYNQPLVKNPVTGGMSIAAARCKAGAAGTTLFNLTFSVNAGASGQLPVNIIQTYLSNGDAGYTTPEYIPILVGALDNEPDLALAYPVLPSTTVAGFIDVPDSDLDGIPDAWETAHFGDLTTATSTSDYDKDGYSDLQEYLNSIKGINDPSGNPYDPKIVNAPGGRGYLTANIAAVSLGADGLYIYNMTNGLDLILDGHRPKQVVFADVDGDGKNELVASFDDVGLLYYHATTGWHFITSDVPQNMVTYNKSVAIDFGLPFGLYKYDTSNGLTCLLWGYDPGKMVAADLNGDGTDEILIVYEPYGLFLYDGANLNFITTDIPQNMLAFNNSVVIDFGLPYGLYKYDSTGFTCIYWGYDPGQMAAADVNGDGKDELVVTYEPYGLFYFDENWQINYIVSTIPQNFVRYGDSIAIDFGLPYGLYKYNTSNGLTCMYWGYNSFDPASMASVDSNNDGEMELLVIYPLEGLYMFHSDEIYPQQIDARIPEAIFPGKFGN